jgi:hypothetical protein
MKSSFLLLIVVSFFSAPIAFGQITKLKPKLGAKKQPVTTTLHLLASEARPVAQVTKSSFDKFYERLGISYFGAYTSPNLEDWDSRYGATAPEAQSKRCNNCDTYAQSLFNQVNFAYNFGGKLKFNIIPRWTMFLGEPSDQDGGQRGMFLIEDAIVGFSGVLFVSADKKFSWFTVPRMRLPTSLASRGNVNKDFGRLNYQLEWNNSFSYVFNKEWEASLSLGNRVWVFDHRYNLSRHRLVTNPSVSYNLNDTTKIQAYYEHFLENNRNWKSINGKNPNYQNNWQNFMVGISHDLTPDLNVLPFISSFVNTVPYSTRALWLGAWISYTIK